MVGIKSKFVSGSILLLVMFNIFNFLNLLFQIFVAHKLSVEVYGIFTALFSTIYIFAIFSESIQLSVAKAVAKAKSISASRKIYGAAMSSSVRISAIILLGYLIFLSAANSLLGIPWGLVLLNGLTIFISLAAPVIRGVLQGQRRFFSLGLNLISEGASKLILGMLAIYLGWQAYGVFGAIIVSMAVPIIYGLVYQIKDVSDGSHVNKGKMSLLSVFRPEIMVLMACVMLFFMLDVFVARAILNAQDAGYYAIASTIAKMAFIGTQPISKAMLSHIAAAKKRSDACKMFSKSIAMICLLLAGGFVLSLFFSDFAVSLFSGNGKSEAASILTLVVAAVSFISLANLVIFYKISTDRIKGAFVLPIAILLLLALLFLSPPTLIGFSLSYLAATIIFLIASILILR